MNELKPEDVMRALECCINWEDNDDCKKCPLYEENDVCECIDDNTALLKYALALLREKDAEIKGLVDGWSKDQDRFEQVCAEKDAEIERLNGVIETMEDRCSTCDNMIVDRVSTARADTITEFAERLKYTLCVNNEENYDYFDYSYTLETIEQIAKELKGETDGNS